MKILSIHDLATIRKKAEHNLLLREESNEKVSEKCYGLSSGAQHLQILICGGTGCKASSSQGITDNLLKAIEKNGITGKVEVITVGCFGFCEKGPIVKIIPDNTFYTQVTPEDAEEIINEHIIGGRRIERLLYVDPKTEHTVSDSKHMDFYRKQQRIALRNCGFINPENIEEYIARHGYLALADSLLHKQPIDVIGVIKRSGLRGRGGGGFPTGLKWESAHKQAADTKYVVCNADEGDPGAFMDRSIMEGDPHSIVEAMTICGYAIGSRQGLVYIRAEYPLAIQRLKTAIAQAREYGLLGERILGTDFCFDIEIRYGAGAFVCGEETALIHSMEGNRGEPTLKPPFPAEAGYLGKPTNVNNVETLANIPIILTKGAEWFSSIGTERSKGTKVFALGGKIHNTGLVEIPMGTTLRTVIEDNAVLQNLANGSPFVSHGCLQYFHCPRSIGSYRAGKETAAGTEAKLCRVEWIFYRTIGRRLADETTWRGRRILTFGQTVDAVVQQNHVQVDVTAYGVDEVITADGQTVTVAGDLPYRQVGIGNLGTCRDGSSTSVDGLHRIRIHVIGQTAGAADT